MISAEEVWKAAQMELDTWKSEVSCALNLSDMLEPYVEETRNLGNPTVGRALLSATGYCYNFEGARSQGLLVVNGGTLPPLKGQGGH